MSYLLHCGDNVAFLKEQETSTVQLTVTSPPYDNLRTYNGFAWDFEAVARELYRVTKPGGVVVWLVADATVNGSETGTSFLQALYFRDVCGFNLHDTMIWNKQSFTAVGALQTRYGPVFEYMFILSKGRPVFNPLKDRKTKNGAGDLHGKLRLPDGTMKLQSNQGKIRAEFGYRFNIWEAWPCANTADDYGNHPAPFPQQLALDHILSWSNPGDLVLDPFLGSGTTGKMAVLAGRNFIGCDISQEYVDMAKKRIDDACLGIEKDPAYFEICKQRIEGAEVVEFKPSPITPVDLCLSHKQENCKQCNP